MVSMKHLASINGYFAVVDNFGTFVVDWQQDPRLAVEYLYTHPAGKLLICQGVQFLDEQTPITTIEPQLTLEDIGLHPSNLGALGIRLIDSMDRLFSQYLDSGSVHYGSAHARRMAYLSIYFAETAPLGIRDMLALIMAAYITDMGRIKENAGHGMKNFGWYLGGVSRVHNVLSAIVASIDASYVWQLRDTNLLETMLEVEHPTGCAGQLAAYLDDMVNLDLVRFDTPVNLRKLHSKATARLIYISREELVLISDKKVLPYTSSKALE
jgi:hypothetical protein